MASNNSLINEAAIDKLITDIASGVYEKEIIDAVIPRIEQGIKDCVGRALDSFYGSYGAIYYTSKTRGFENVGELVRVDNTRILIRYLPTDADGGYHQSTDLVFQNVFMKGYHGGSKGEGSSGIQWRTPYPYYKHWGRSAAQSTSIFDLAEKEMDIFWDNEILPLARQKMIERFVKVLQ